MKVAVVMAALVACATAVKTAPLLAEHSPTRVPGEYVVIFDEQVSDDEVTTHLFTVRNLMSYHGNGTNVLMNEYHIGKFRGYGAKMDDKLRDIVRTMNHVQYVECSQYYHTMQDPCALQTGATWGIVRTTFVNLPTPEDYTMYSYTTGAGEGVQIYIIDTGIYTQHRDFSGRAVWGADFVDTPSPRTDLNGHGTHVAGTVMSDTWGLAKKGTAIAVRVLDQNGSGTTDGVIGGINWTAGQHSPGKKSVANMSLGGGKSNALNDAVDAAVVAGVNFAVAAGNEAQSACNVSPASATNCVTVGASDIGDRFAGFSNYGNCENIIAPGVDITSTWLNGGTNTISGTSMAAPHVAGVMAKYLSDLPSSTTPFQLTDIIVKEASEGKVSGLTGPVKGSTPNLLIFKECL
jgi:subtilisin family serine protease